MLLGVKTDFLKMLSAIIVALFLAVPYLKGRYFTKYKYVPDGASEDSSGGSENA